MIIITAFLLAAEVVWLLSHLQIIPSPFKKLSLEREKSPAGVVLKSQRELRRRSMDSLVWENSGIEDTLYNYDSVLTLSQSSATLLLHGETEVHLSENTLVTIEPLDQGTENQIRLKFSRGDLRARNPLASTLIETDEWSLNLGEGSEVSLRQTGQEKFEVEVLKGEAKFLQENEAQTLSQNQLLKIDDNKPAETVALTSDLQFQGPDYQRVYSSESTLNLPVEWKGSADQLEVLPQGEDKIIRSVRADQSTEKLNLPPGKYTLRLIKNGKASAAKEVEVWQAPVVQLLSPFPRDRVKTEQSVSFVWTSLNEVKGYKFVLIDKNGKTVFEKPVKDHYFFHTFDTEGQYDWKIIAIDQDGFEIPSSYSNPILSTEELLAAPKLKSPELRKPASPKKKNDGALFFQKPRALSQQVATSKWWRVLTSAMVSRAHADDLLGDLEKDAAKKATVQNSKNVADFEAVFAWEKVDGADQYVIEISSTSDFRKTLLSQTTRKTEFAWQGFQLGTYYWRVAAGSKKGKMGAFSEPAKVALEKMPEKESFEEGVLIRKKLDPEKQRAPVITKDDDIIQNAPKPNFDQKRFEKDVVFKHVENRDLEDSYLFAWTPSYFGWNLTGSDQLKSQFQGSSTGSFHFQTEQAGRTKEKSVLIDIQYNQVKWRPKNTDSHPYQEDLTWSDAKAHALFGASDSMLLKGLSVMTVPTLERSDLEEVRLKTNIVLGPSVYYIWQNKERWKSGHTLSFLAGSGLFAFSTQNHFRYQFFQTESLKVFLGIHVQADIYFHKQNTNSTYSSGLFTGFDF